MSNTKESLSSVAFATSQSGWAMGDNGTILHTEDGGKNWHLEASTMRWFHSVAFATPQFGWAVGWNGTILHTEDGGESWNSQVSNTKEQLFSVAFVTPQIGWAAGNNGAILHTDDGGKSWTPQVSNTKGNAPLRRLRHAAIGLGCGLERHHPAHRGRRKKLDSSSQQGIKGVSFASLLLQRN